MVQALLMRRVGNELWAMVQSCTGDMVTDARGHGLVARQIRNSSMHLQLPRDPEILRACDHVTRAAAFCLLDIVESRLRSKETI